jgi:hypothetical protein
MAYQGRNNNKCYGSLEALQADGYYDLSYTRKSLIGHYSLSWRMWNYIPESTAFERGDPWGNLFTIIAYPDNPERLSTFLITDDQVVRGFHPENGNEFDAFYHWDPVE